MIYPLKIVIFHNYVYITGIYWRVPPYICSTGKITNRVYCLLLYKLYYPSNMRFIHDKHIIFGMIYYYITIYYIGPDN